MLKEGKHHQNIRPISYTQQRMWLLDRLEPGNPAYNIARVIRMRGSLSREVLQESLQGMVTRHGSLRTTFAEIDGAPVQVIAVSGSLEVPTIDLRDVPEPERESETLRLARDEVQRPFDLAKGPLIRAKLI